MLRNTLAYSCMCLGAAAILLSTGCPQPSPSPLPGSSTIDALTVSGATVGSTGQIRVTLVDPVASDTNVTLASSNTLVAAAPSTVTIVTGSTTGQTSYNAVAAGDATITAVLGGSQRSAVATVVPSLRVISVDAPAAVQTGGAVAITVTANIPVPTDTAVALASSDTSIISVPTSVTIPQFSDSQSFSVTAGNAGTATITATLGSSARATTITVVSTLSIASLSAPARLQVGATGLMTLSLNAEPAADTVVILSSSNSAVINVPSAVVVPAGSTSTQIPLTGLAVGGTTITATAGTSSQAVFVEVASSAGLDTLTVDNNRLLVGGATNLRISLTAVPTSNVTVALTSTNPATVAVPASITIPAGQSSFTVPLTGLAAGKATITATVDSVQQSVDVFVGTTPSVLAIIAPARLQPGASSTLLVTLDFPPLADTPVTLTSSSASVVPVPASVTVLAGQTAASIPLTAGAAGTTLITATLGTSSQTASVAVIGTLEIAQLITVGSLQVGAAAQLTIVLDTVVANDTPATLAASPAGVVAVPSAVIIPANAASVSVAILGLSAGTANITATVGTATRTVTVTVVSTVTVTTVSGAVTVGQAGVITVGLNAIVAADTTVALTNSNPAAFTTPASVVVPSGQNSISFSVVGLAPVPTTITATVGASSANVTITPAP